MKEYDIRHMSISDTQLEVNIGDIVFVKNCKVKCCKAYTEKNCDECCLNYCGENCFKLNCDLGSRKDNNDVCFKLIEE